MNIQRQQQTLAKQVAVVVGGGRGIGQAIARALSEAGAVVAVVARSENEVSETTASIEAMGGKVVSFVLDAIDEQAVEHMVKEVEQQLGPVDILVNSAGRHRAIGPLWKVGADEWRMDVESNLFGTFFPMHAVLPTMIARRHGRIINISSAAGNMPRPYSTAYTTAKAAVTRLTESVALSTKEHGVYVFAIHPGSVRTAMADHLIYSEEGQTWVPEFRRIYDETEIPPERTGQLVVFLASGKADALTGRFINVYEDVEELVKNAESIQQQDLYTLRLHTTK